MKKITLFTALAFATGMLFAQNSNLPLDFEAADDTYIIFPFGGLEASIIANPDMDGNDSSRVYSMTKPSGAETFAGAAFVQGDDDPIDFSESTVITVQVWSPVVGTVFTVKVEDENLPEDNPNDEAFFTQVAVANTVANEWETLSFNISIPDTGVFNADSNYTNVVIFPNLNQPGTATDNTFFIDNILVDTNLSVGDVDLLGLNIFPNPTTSELNLQANTAIQSVSIYNILGQVVRSFEGTSTSAQLDVQDLKAGTYIAQVQTAEGTSALRFIKQ